MTVARFQIKHIRYTPIFTNLRCYRLTLAIILITNRLFLCLRIYIYIYYGYIIIHTNILSLNFSIALLQQLYNIGVTEMRGQYSCYNK